MFVNPLRCKGLLAEGGDRWPAAAPVPTAAPRRCALRLGTLLLAGGCLLALPAWAQDLPEAETPVLAPADDFGGEDGFGGTRAEAPTGPTQFFAAWTSALAADTLAEDPGEDVLLWRNRLDLDVTHPASATLRVHLAGRLWHRASLGHEPGSWAPATRATPPDFGLRYDQQAQLREANLQRTIGESRLTVGREVLRWGALDLQSPLAILCPMDFSQGLAGALTNPDEPPVLPTWLVRWERPLGPGRIDLVYLPFFDQHQFSAFATDTALVRPGLGPELPAAMAGWLAALDTRLDRSLGESLMLALRPPSATPLDGSVAARWSTHLGPVDLAAVAMLTWDRMPELALDQDLLLLLGKTWEAGYDTAKLAAAFADPAFQAAASRSQGKQLVDLARASWHRRAVLGAELQWELADGWVLRSDLAWSHQRVLMDMNFKAILSPLLQAGLGLEHSVGDWLNLLMEGTWNWASAAPTGLPLLLAARHQVQIGGGVIARLGESQQWSCQLAGFYGISLNDWALAPRVAWSFSEAWRVGLGAALTGGPLNSPGGLFAHDGQVLVELRRVW